MRRPGALGRVSLFATALIIRGGGKLLCQLFFGFMWFSWCWLGEFLGYEGLDKGFAGDFEGDGTRACPGG